MKAIVCPSYASQDALQLKQVETPTPRENELLKDARSDGVESADLPQGQHQHHCHPGSTRSGYTISTGCISWPSWGVFLLHAVRPFDHLDWPIKNAEQSIVVTMFVAFFVPWGGSFLAFILGAQT